MSAYKFNSVGVSKEYAKSVIKSAEFEAYVAEMEGVDEFNAQDMIVEETSYTIKVFYMYEGEKELVTTFFCN